MSLDLLKVTTKDSCCGWKCSGSGAPPPPLFGIDELSSWA